MNIRAYFRALLDLFYPRFCFHCNCSLNNLQELYICSNCKQQISYASDTHCSRCGAVLGPYMTSTVQEGCVICKRKSFYFDSITFTAYYEGVMRTLIHKFKYARQRFLCSMLNDMIIMQGKLEKIASNIDIIVPIPLYWLKRIHRGFNQSELLSIGIQKYFSKPLSTNNLCRIKSTLSQTHLSKGQRRINVHNAFFVKYPAFFKGKKILLVDDVFTTGVTASECSKKLKEAGAESVHVFVLALAEYSD